MISSFSLLLVVFTSYAIFLVRGFGVGSSCPVVICPGFCNDNTDYEKFKSSLTRRGFDSKQIHTVPVKRHDWLRVFGGLVLDTQNFVKGTQTPFGVSYGWYIDRVKDTVDRAYKESGNEKVLLIGHSAGGWLARAAMADGVWKKNKKSSFRELSIDDNDKDSDDVIRTCDRIQCLTTIGSVHKAPEKNNDHSCITRGALEYTDEHFPGAFLKNGQGIRYVSVGGYCDDDCCEDENRSSVAYTSYKAVSGNDNYKVGDGIVPLPWTQLDGSKKIQLKNVLHSVHHESRNRIGTLSSKNTKTNSWYGSENVIDEWLSPVLEEAKILAADENRIRSPTAVKATNTAIWQQLKQKREQSTKELSYNINHVRTINILFKRIARHLLNKWNTILLAASATSRLQLALSP